MLTAQIVGAWAYGVLAASSIEAETTASISHLHEHLTTGDPVVVVGGRKAGRLVALSIEDA